MINTEISVVIELSNYPISPDQIDVTEDFLGVFGRCASETAAVYIIRLCQKNKGWQPFTLGDLKRIKMDRTDKLLVPTGVWCLVQGEFIVHKKRRYYLTEEFIQRCYNNFPVNSQLTLEL